MILTVNQPLDRSAEYDGRVAQGEDRCLRRGPTRCLPELLRPSCNLNSTALSEGPQVDLDGDGRTERLVDISGTLAILRETPAGWVADIVELLEPGAFREELSWQEPLRAGGAVYAATLSYAWESFGGGENDDGTPEEPYTDQINTAALLRRLPDGHLYKVFEYTYDGDTEDCRFTGSPDQSVTLRCKEGNVRLLFDERLRRLVPR